MTTPSIPIGIIGPPGTGKSTFILNAIEWLAEQDKKMLVLCAPPREADTYPAESVVRLIDNGFDPLMESFDATAYMKGQKMLRQALRRDDIGGVAIDTFGPGYSDLAMNFSLGSFNATTPNDVANGGAYVSYNNYIRYALAYLDDLVEAGKLVICTFHGMMNEQEGTGEAKQVRDIKAGKGNTRLKYEDQYLPIMHSKVRQAISGRFSLWMGSFSEGTKLSKKCFLTTMPTEASPSKKCVKLNLPKNVLETRIPNDFRTIWEAIER